MTPDQKSRRIQLIRKDIDGEITLEEISELKELNSVYFSLYGPKSQLPK